MDALSLEFKAKLFRIFAGCTTPEQFRIAARYMKLAERQGYVHGFDFCNVDTLEILEDEFEDEFIADTKRLS